VAVLVAEDRLEQRPRPGIASPTEVPGVELELAAPALLAAMHERQKPGLAEPLEQVLGVGERRRERRALLGDAQLGRAALEHARVAGLVERVAQVQRATRQRGRAVRRLQQIDPAALLGLREAVQLARTMPRHAPHDRRHEVDQRLPHRGLPGARRVHARSTAQLVSATGPDRREAEVVIAGWNMRCGT
jgi:hypothetical protein